MKNISKLITAIIFIFNNYCLAQQPGALDSTFDADGKVITSIGTVEDRVYSIAMQPDGKIVAGGLDRTGGKRSFAIARYNTDGSLDSTFGVNGKVITSISTGDNRIYALALQSDGKIVAAGEGFNGSNKDFAMARFTVSGILDSTFGINGIQLTDILNDDIAFDLSITPFGKIYLGGMYNEISSNSAFALARYDSTGILDTTFNGTGIASVDIGAGEYLESIALQIDGKIITAGNTNNVFSDFGLVRFDTLGIVDSTFGINGIVITDMGSTFDAIYSCDLQPDGKIVVGGSVDFTGTGLNHDFALARYNPDGTLDSSFNTTGKVITALSGYRDIITEIKIQADGRILAAGYTGNTPDINFALVRYNINGTLDNSFGNNGIVITDFAGDNDVAYTMDIQPDLKIVAAGATYQNSKWNFALARYVSGLNVGTIEFEKGDNAILIYPNPIKEHATLKYTIAKDESISVNLFDLNGRLIKTLVKNERKLSGEHEEELFFNKAIAPGNYVLQISNGKTGQGVKIIKQ